MENRRIHALGVSLASLLSHSPAYTVFTCRYCTHLQVQYARSGALLHMHAGKLAGGHGDLRPPGSCKKAQVVISRA